MQSREYHHAVARINQQLQKQIPVYPLRRLIQRLAMIFKRPPPPIKRIRRSLKSSRLARINAANRDHDTGGPRWTSHVLDGFQRVAGGTNCTANGRDGVDPGPESFFGSLTAGVAPGVTAFISFDNSLTVSEALLRLRVLGPFSERIFSSSVFLYDGSWSVRSTNCCEVFQPITPINPTKTATTRKIAIERGILSFSRNATGAANTIETSNASASGTKTTRAKYRVPITTTAATRPKRCALSVAADARRKGLFMENNQHSQPSSPIQARRGIHDSPTRQVRHE